MTSATTTTSTGSSPRVLTERDKRNDWIRLVLVLAALTLALRLPAFFVDVFNSDETFLATQAQVINEGGDLYREATDRKPPMVPYVYAGTFEFFGTSDLWTVRVAAMGAVVLTAVLLAMEAKRRYGRRAAWAAGLLCVFGLVAFAPQDGQAANFEVFMLPAMTAAILLARRGRATSAGVAVAIATLAKQTGAATLLPVLYLVWKARGRGGAGRAALGFTVPLALVALAMGPLQVIYWTVLGNGSYVSVETASTYVLSTLLLMSLAWAACNLPIVWRLPVAWRDRAKVARDGGNDIDLWLWLASATLSVMVGLRFFGHYYLQLVPPLCLLTAGALARGSRRIATWTVAAAAVFAIAFSAAGYFMQPFSDSARYAAACRYVVKHTTRSDRILVWGNLPELYWCSGRLPATRFPATGSLLAGTHPGRPVEDAAPEETSTVVWDWFFEDLDAHAPRYIIDTAPAAIRGAQYTPISRFPTLQRLVDRHYHYVRSIADMAIYERNATSK